MSRRKVLFVVGSVGRDTEAFALVAFRLGRQAQCDVRFCELERSLESLKAERPEVVVFERPFAPGLALARSLGSRVVILPSIGFLQAPELFQGSWMVRDKVVADAIDRYGTWEDRSRELLLAGGLFGADQVVTVGCPRFDFYRPPYTALFEGRSGALASLGIRNVEAPLIAWPTATYFRRLQSQGRPSGRSGFGGKQRRQSDLEWEDEIGLHEDISRLLLDLAAKRPDYNFVFKIHPSEIPDAYHEMVAGRPNVFITRNADLRTLFHHSSVVVQHGSTTATEAWLLDKPVIDVAFREYHYPTPSDLRNGLDVASTAEEAIRWIDGYSRGAALAPRQVAARNRVLTEVYSTADGRACDRCADLILDLLRTGKRPVEAAVPLGAAKSRGAVLRPKSGAGLKSLLKRVRGVVRSLRGGARGTPAPAGSSQPDARLSGPSIAALFERFEKACPESGCALNEVDRGPKAGRSVGES